MEKIVTQALVFLALMIVMPLGGVLLGGFSGWVVGLFWSDQIVDFLSRLGVNTKGLTVWEIGAAMGFLGGFLKTNASISSSSK